MLDLRCLGDEEAFLSNLSHFKVIARNGTGAGFVRGALSEGRAAVIVGLAGHIDHGKTALVKALTGVAGDRLKDEKARGITIDLGFAYMPTRSGPPIGFIDVPGHERFVHTMLAGASGIDFALLTIAVDDGIMPQTLEHLAILDLLGVDRGAVVLTKTDLASPESIEHVARQAKAMIAATALAHAEILTVSALTGEGVDALRARLEAGGRRDARSGEQARDFGSRSIASSRCLASGSLRPGRCCRVRSMSGTGSSSAHRACSRACGLFMRKTARPRRRMRASAARSISRAQA